MYMSQKGSPFLKETDSLFVWNHQGNCLKQTIIVSRTKAYTSIDRQMNTI